MTSPASRAGVMAAIALLSILAPFIGAATPLLFAVIALATLTVPANSRVFERLATHADREVGQLRTLSGIVFAIAVLALLGTVDTFDLSVVVFSIAVIVVCVGDWVGTVVAQAREGKLARTVGSGLGGGGAAYLVYLVFLGVPGVEPAESHALVIFLVAVGALSASLYRWELRREDHLEVLTVGLLLWFFAEIGVGVTLDRTMTALAVTVALGILAYMTQTASIPGMLSGILLALITFVFGGVGWFVVLAAFFVIGGLATKFRFDEKASRGVAEADQGVRGTSNVMSNGIVPLLIVVAMQATSALEPVIVGNLPDEIFIWAFAGAVATALADTLASEIGALYDSPRLITSFEKVSPGTDGAVTFQGHVAGLLGAGIIAGIVMAVFPFAHPIIAIIIVVAGFIGMIADSLFGATLEGNLVNNEGVNLLATFVGAILALAGTGIALTVL